MPLVRPHHPQWRQWSAHTALPREFDYIDGAQSLADVRLTEPIVSLTRAGLSVLHSAGAMVGDFTAHHIVDQQEKGREGAADRGEASELRVYWVNPPISAVIPHPLHCRWSAEKVAEDMEGSRLELELGLLWLSEVSS